MIGGFDHTWLGGLFDDPEMRDLWSSERQLGHMLAFEAAWSRALGAVGRADAQDAESVAQLIEAYQPNLADLRAGTARDGLPVPALISQIKAHVGTHSSCVHAGATSQDVIDTGLAITISESLDLIDGRLSALSDGLAELGKAHGANGLMGYTRMQAALPITAGERIAAWRAPLAGLISQSEDARTRAVRLQVGGAVGDRQALGGDAAAMARNLADQLGLPDPERAWHSDRQGVVAFANLLSQISGATGKIGQDICLMAQAGADQIVLSAGGGSSAMAHKNNPIMAELLVTLARFNATQVGALHQSLVHEQERSGAAWALEWMVLPQMAAAAGRSLSAAAELLGRIERIGTHG